jgi:hypothetical protein
VTAARGTQSERLLAYLKSNPGASSLEITLATRIVNVTGRISDLRAAGHRIDCVMDERHVARYVVVDKPVQVTLW